MPATARIQLACALPGLLLAAGAIAGGTPPPPPPPPPVTDATSPRLDVRSRELNPPRYPSEQVLSGISGTVVLLVDVRADGSVGDVAVDKSSGSEGLDLAARDAARAWRFEPGQVAGRPTGGRVRVPVTFDLGPEPGAPLLDPSLPIPAWDAAHPVRTGVAQCDRFFNAVLACVEGKVPPQAFDALLQETDRTRRSVEGMSAAQREDTAQSCTAALARFGAGHAAAGCEFTP
ncbi:MAG: energy transducer TonB [Lysobacteraceae bacterium]|nr:MAG: energy transducer TonB [Xanthomonadaceae bacterium]